MYTTEDKEAAMLFHKGKDQRQLPTLDGKSLLHTPCVLHGVTCVEAWITKAPFQLINKTSQFP